MRPLYQQSQAEFRCFEDSKLINASQVNDNYCDCKDGSDEPGTSACINGVFCCRNAYYRSKMIPSSKVDDRICDCCDGSDESEEGYCANTCKALFEAEFQRLKDEFNKIEHAKHKCDEYLNSEKYSPQYYHDQIEIHVQEKTQFEAKHSHLSDLRNQAQDLFSAMKNDYTEKHLHELEEKKKDFLTGAVDEIFSQLDRNNDTALDKSEFNFLLTRLNEDLLPKDVFIQRLTENQTFYDNFKSIAKDSYAYSLESEQRKFNNNDTNAEAIEPDNNDNDDDNDNDNDEEEIPAETTTYNAEHTVEDDAKLELNENETEIRPEFPGWDSPFHANETTETEEPTGKIETISYDTWRNVSNLLKEMSSKEFQVDFPPEIIEKEEEFKKIEAEFSNLKQEIDHLSKHIDILKSFENIDFGPNRIFSLLFHDCYLFKDSINVYTYEVCPFKYIKQIENRKNTTIGYWDSWSRDDNNKLTYQTMRFTRGDNCYSSKDRKSNMNLKCGKENKVISVSETSTCEYDVVFETVVACYAVPTPKLDESVYHDEL